MFAEDVWRPAPIEPLQSSQPAQPRRTGRRGFAQKSQLLVEMLLEVHGNPPDVDFGRPGRRRRLSHR